VSEEKNNSSGEATRQPDAASEPVAQSEGGATEAAPKPSGSPLAQKAEAPSSAPVKAPRAKKGSSFIGWLALLLVLALGGAAYWTVLQAMQREQALQGRIAELEGASGSEQVDLVALERQWDQQLQQGLDESRAESATQAQQVEELRSQIAAQQEKLASFSANDHESWLRAEAQYLMRLANQRVIMARDVESALALLASADSILQQLDDPTLYEVRGAVAAEQAALRAVPRVDVEGIYLRLSALIEQADNLVIFQMQEQEAQPESEASDGDWQLRLERGYEEATRKLSDYIVIRRRDVPMRALMDPQWEGLVRQNLRMLLEQAQVALLSGNQTLYTESLQRSQHWVAQFFDSDEAASRAMEREISQLEQQTVQVIMPDLSRSLKSLDQAMKRQLQQGGAE
jgi:uroporphyrin-III C-methyltransferase